MNKQTHVYCTNCIYGKELIASIDDQEPIPKICCSCYPFDPEDSEPYERRPKYIELKRTYVDPEIVAKMPESGKTFLEESVFEIVWKNIKSWLHQFK